MRESATLDDLDYRIIGALQASPRADWQRIGQVVQASASTVARRWARMTDAGLAWMSCYATRQPGVSPMVALIEVDCFPTRLYSVAEHLLDDPHTFNIGHVTGPCDLLVTAVFADHASLARYVGFRLAELDGVAAIRSQIVTTIHSDGSRWRLQRLDQQQTAILRRSRPDRPAATGPRTDPDESDVALIAAISTDCRQSIVELAKRTGMSPTTVQRRLARLEADRTLTYRCEVARYLSGWPVSVTLWGSVPPSGAAAVAAQLNGLREVRMCMSLTGRHNLTFTVWLRSLDDLPALETRLTTRIPELAITERAVTLWPLKFAQHILDPNGRHIRHVPTPAWPDSKATERETSFLERIRAGRSPAAVHHRAGT
jgi:DNA-binding Lrp family transcriptional regulator